MVNMRLPVALIRPLLIVLAVIAAVLLPNPLATAADTYDERIDQHIK